MRDKKIVRMLDALWFRLTEPQTDLDPADRRSAKLLSSLCLVLITLGLVMGIVQLAVVPGFLFRFLIILAALGVLAAGYRASRTRHYRKVAAVVSFVPIVASGAVALSGPQDPTWFAFSSLSVVIASTFLSWRQALAVALVNVFAVGVVSSIIHSGFSQVVIPGGLDFNIILGALVLTTARHRGLVERDRQRSLQESETNYRTLFENSPVGVGVADGNGFLLTCNDAMLESAGYTRQDVSAQTNVASFYYDPDERSDVLSRLSNHGYLRGEEVRMKRADGTPFETMLSLAPIRFRGGNCVLAIVQDISKRVAAEEALRSSREELRQLARRLERVREEERTAVAREIHDDLGQVLTAIKLDLSWAMARLSEGESKERLGETKKLVDRGLSVVRSIVSRIRPPLLDDLGILAAIEWYAHDFERRSQIRFDLDLDPGAERLPRSRMTVLFRIFQETCTNILRHSRAARASVALLGDEDGVTLTVCDDGCGIPEPATRSKESFGLIGMRENASSLGGSVRIGRAPEGGTEVVLRIPWDSPVSEPVNPVTT